MKKMERKRHGWRIKYYKGLGTSTTKEAKEYFRKLKIITYNPVIPQTTEIPQQEGGEGEVVNAVPLVKNDRLDLAFNKKRSNDRKLWLLDYDKSRYPDFNRKNMSFQEFVDDELIHFSNEDNDRFYP